MKVMLVDDEAAMCTLVGRVLSDAGYEFCSVGDAASALASFDAEDPDLLLLDVMLPEMDGFELCALFREKGVAIPIIILSAKGDIVDKQVGFNSGADDYLVKPFSTKELQLRVHAHLRKHDRTATQKVGACASAGIELDPKRNEIIMNGKHIVMTPKEFRILALLASHPGEVFTKEQLVEDAWGPQFVGETTSLAVFIRKIREKIEENPSDPKLLQTVWSIGYRFGI